jgi:hypothetical protein
MWNWLLKLVGGWLPIGTKPFPEWAGKVIWAVGIWTACAWVSSKVFPEKPVVQNIGTQIVQNDQRDMMGFGCSMMRAYLKAGVKAK